MSADGGSAGWSFCPPSVAGRDLRKIGGAARHRLERLVLVLADGADPELVDRVGEQQHLDAALDEAFELRARGERLRVVAGDGEDRVLARFHAADIVGEADPFVAVWRSCGSARAPSSVSRCSAILVEAFLEHRPEIGPERRVIGGVVPGLLLEIGQHALDDAGADQRQHRIVLQHLAADVERQILGIDDAAQEAQIARQQVVGAVGDEDALHVQLHAVLAVGMVEVEGRRGRDVEQARVFDLALGAPMERQPRLVEACATWA